MTNEHIQIHEQDDTESPETERLRRDIRYLRLLVGHKNEKIVELMAQLKAMKIQQDSQQAKTN